MKKYIVTIVLVAISFTLGYYAKPVKVETKIVEKYIKDTTIRADVDEHEVIKPDGTKTITRKIKYEEKSKEQKEKQITEKYKGLPNHLLGLQHRLDTQTMVPRNAVTYSYRMFSSLYIGTYVEVDKKPGYGVSLTIGF